MVRLISALTLCGSALIAKAQKLDAFDDGSDGEIKMLKDYDYTDYDPNDDPDLDVDYVYPDENSADPNLFSKSGPATMKGGKGDDFDFDTDSDPDIFGPEEDFECEKGGHDILFYFDGYSTGGPKLRQAVLDVFDKTFPLNVNDEKNRIGMYISNQDFPHPSKGISLFNPHAQLDFEIDRKLLKMHTLAIPAMTPTFTLTSMNQAVAGYYRTSFRQDSIKHVVAFVHEWEHSHDVKVLGVDAVSNKTKTYCSIYDDMIKQAGVYTHFFLVPEENNMENNQLDALEIEIQSCIEDEHKKYVTVVKLDEPFSSGNIPESIKRAITSNLAESVCDFNSPIEIGDNGDFEKMTNYECENRDAERYEVDEKNGLQRSQLRSYHICASFNHTVGQEVTFILDASLAMTSKGFLDQKKFMRRLLKRLDPCDRYTVIRITDREKSELPASAYSTTGSSRPMAESQYEKGAFPLTYAEDFGEFGAGVPAIRAAEMLEIYLDYEKTATRDITGAVHTAYKIASRPDKPKNVVHKTILVMSSAPHNAAAKEQLAALRKYSNVMYIAANARSSVGSAFYMNNKNEYHTLFNYFQRGWTLKLFCDRLTFESFKGYDDLLNELSVNQIAKWIHCSQTDVCEPAPFPVAPPKPQNEANPNQNQYACEEKIDIHISVDPFSGAEVLDRVGSVLEVFLGGFLFHQDYAHLYVNNIQLTSGEKNDVIPRALDIFGNIPVFAPDSFLVDRQYLAKREEYRECYKKQLKDSSVDLGCRKYSNIILLSNDATWMEYQDGILEYIKNSKSGPNQKGDTQIWLTSDVQKTSSIKQKIKVDELKEWFDKSVVELSIGMPVGTLRDRIAPMIVNQVCQQELTIPELYFEPAAEAPETCSYPTDIGIVVDPSIDESKYRFAIVDMMNILTEKYVNLGNNPKNNTRLALYIANAPLKEEIIDSAGNKEVKLLFDDEMNQWMDRQQTSFLASQPYGFDFNDFDKIGCSEQGYSALQGSGLHSSAFEEYKARTGKQQQAGSGHQPQSDSFGNRWVPKCDDWDLDKMRNPYIYNWNGWMPKDANKEPMYKTPKAIDFNKSLYDILTKGFDNHGARDRRTSNAPPKRQLILLINDYSNLKASTFEYAALYDVILHVVLFNPSDSVLQSKPFLTSTLYPDPQSLNWKKFSRFALKGLETDISSGQSYRGSYRLPAGKSSAGVFHAIEMLSPQNVDPIIESSCIEPKEILTCNVQADLGILLDGSKSISHIGFNKALNFLKDLLLKIHIGPENVRVGILQFSKNISDPYYYNLQPRIRVDNDVLLASLSDMYLEGDGTYIGNGINGLYEMMYEERRKDVKGIALIITDGKSMDDLKLAADRLNSQSNMMTVVIGIGQETEAKNVPALVAAASENPIRPGERLFFHVSKTKDMSELLNRFSAYLCGTAEQGAEEDIDEQEVEARAAAPQKDALECSDAMFAQGMIESEFCANAHKYDKEDKYKDDPNVPPYMPVHPVFNLTENDLEEFHACSEVTDRLANNARWNFQQKKFLILTDYSGLNKFKDYLFQFHYKFMLPIFFNGTNSAVWNVWQNRHFGNILRINDKELPHKAVDDDSMALFRNMDVEGCHLSSKIDRRTRKQNAASCGLGQNQYYNERYERAGRPSPTRPADYRLIQRWVSHADAVIFFNTKYQDPRKQQILSDQLYRVLDSSKKPYLIMHSQDPAIPLKNNDLRHADKITTGWMHNEFHKIEFRRYQNHVLDFVCETTKKFNGM